MFGKCMVSAIVCWHTHYCPCAITCQHIVSYPNGNLNTSKWMNGICASKLTGNFFHISHSLSLTSATWIINICQNIINIISSWNLFYQFMFGCQSDKTHAKNGIWSCCKNLHRKISILYVKMNAASWWPTNPIALCILYTFAPINSFQIEQ